MKKHRILFIYSHWQSFVREDYQLLADVFNVKKLRFILHKSPFSFFIYQIISVFKLLYFIIRTDIVYIWFCDYHAFWAVLLAKIFRKKSVIVVGGFDAVKIPLIDYGIFMKNNFRSRLAKWAYKNCNRIVAVDRSLIKGENTFAGLGAKSGVAHFVAGVEGKSIVIPTGYDAEKWKIADKKKQVLTVALIKDAKVFYRKGIDLFLEVAQQLPDIPFVIVGLQDTSLIPSHLQNLKNLSIYPIVPQDELIALYAESQVYCQFSLSEGLPNVLCEAMMSGCVPVGSSANGIPLAIGDCGYVLEEKKVSSATEYVKKALFSGEKSAEKSRHRILSLFPKKQRKQKLNELIEQLMS